MRSNKKTQQVVDIHFTSSYLSMPPFVSALAAEEQKAAQKAAIKIAAAKQKEQAARKEALQMAKQAYLDQRNAEKNNMSVLEWRRKEQYQPNSDAKSNYSEDAKMSDNDSEAVTVVEATSPAAPADSKPSSSTSRQRGA